MKLLYVDTSVMVSLLFGDKQAKEFQGILSEAEEIFTSYLTEAELFAAAVSEDLDLKELDNYLKTISFILPDRSLSEEYREIFEHGYANGTDAHHLACALYLDPTKQKLSFLTADKKQHQLARNLGFKTR